MNYSPAVESAWYVDYAHNKLGQVKIRDERDNIFGELNDKEGFIVLSNTIPARGALRYNPNMKLIQILTYTGKVGYIRSGWWKIDGETNLPILVKIYG